MSYDPEQGMGAAEGAVLSNVVLVHRMIKGEAGSV